MGGGTQQRSGTAFVIRKTYGRLPVPFRRQVRRARFAMQRRHDPAAADAAAHALRGGIARGNVRARRMGMDLVLDLQDGASRVAYFTGGVERPLLALWQSELRPGDVVADIGAHIGITAVSAAQVLRDLGGGKVYAFEASPDTAQRLRDHVVANGVESLAEVVEVVLLDAEGVAHLCADAFFGNADASTRSLFGTGDPVTGSLRTRTFDSWALETGLDRLDLVKLDVEGAETSVIDGMRDALDRFRPRLIVVEEKDYIFERAGEPPDAVRRRLRDAGYEIEGTIRRYAPRSSTEHDEANMVYRRR